MGCFFFSSSDPGPSSAGAKTAFGSSENEKTNKVSLFKIDK